MVFEVSSGTTILRKCNSEGVFFGAIFTYKPTLLFPSTSSFLHNTQSFTKRYTKKGLPLLSLATVMSEITLYCADWCKPCTFLKENVTAWAAEVQCEIPIKVVEYDSELHCIEKLPTMCYTYDGLERQRIAGTDKTKIKVWLMNCIAYEQFSLFGYED